MSKLVRLGQWLRSWWPGRSGQIKSLPGPAAGPVRVVVQSPLLPQLAAPVNVTALPIQLSTSMRGTIFYGKLPETDRHPDFTGVAVVSVAGRNRGLFDRLARDLAARLFAQFALAEAGGNKQVKVEMGLILTVDRDNLVTLQFSCAAR